MHEESTNPESGSQEQQATNKNSDGTEGGSIPKSSNDDTASPWVPGIVEVEFKADVAPEITTNEEENRFEIKSSAGRSLSKFNQLITGRGLVRAALTFQTPREKAANLQAIALQQGITVPSLSNFVTLYFTPGVDVEQIARELDETDEVEHAWPVPQSEPPVAIFNDELLGKNDQLPRSGPDDLDTQWYVFRCRANHAWKLGFTGKGVVLADVDWGYKVTHPELVKRLDPQNCHNSVDQSQNVSFPQRTDHGTAVLGLAGAGSDGSGMVGFAHDAELWAIQANAGNCPTDGVTEWVRAFEWVLARPSAKRKIILLERQAIGGINIEMERALNVIIRTVIANGIVVCVTAGNGGRDAGLDINNKPIEPTNSILVGATTFHPKINRRHSSSNFGPRVVVSAPGDDEHDVTCGTEEGKPFKNDFGGTSGAAPKVAGAVALMLEANPYIKHSDVREILNRTGTDVTEDDKPIGRFLDCEAAVRAAQIAPAWGTTWQQLPGKALDVVFAPDGSALHLGFDRIVYRWDEKALSWLEQGSTNEAVKIAMDTENPWYIALGGDIFHWMEGVWRQIPGQALDIRVGANGSVWRVGTDNRTYQWLNSSWEADNIDSSATRIAVGPDGSPWYISSATGDIYKRVGNTWQQVPGQALDISIGADGSVWRIGQNVVGDGNSMSRWSGSDWEPIDGAAAVIAVAPNGLPWRVNRSGDIFRRI